MVLRNAVLAREIGRASDVVVGDLDTNTGAQIFGMFIASIRPANASFSQRSARSQRWNKWPTRYGASEIEHARHMVFPRWRAICTPTIEVQSATDPPPP